MAWCCSPWRDSTVILAPDNGRFSSVVTVTSYSPVVACSGTLKAVTKLIAPNRKYEGAVRLVIIKSPI